jgi:hypothetical protein
VRPCHKFWTLSKGKIYLSVRKLVSKIVLCLGALIFLAFTGSSAYAAIFARGVVSPSPLSSFILSLSTLFSIPEPASMILFGTSLATIASRLRKRRQTAVDQESRKFSGDFLEKANY